jgi:hypothetical protein
LKEIDEAPYQGAAGNAAGDFLVFLLSGGGLSVHKDPFPFPQGGGVEPELNREASLEKARRKEGVPPGEQLEPGFREKSSRTVSPGTVCVYHLDSARLHDPVSGGVLEGRGIEGQVEIGRCFHSLL